MNWKLLLKKAWIAIDLGLPGWAYALTNPASRWAKTGIALSSQVCVPVRSLEGTGSGGPLHMAYVGLRRHLDYVSTLVFDSSPSVWETTHTTLFRLRQIIPTLRRDHDLIIIELPYPFLLRFSGWDGFTTMPWLRHRLDLTVPWEEIDARFRRKTLKSSLKKVSEKHFTCVTSHNPAEFEQFYHQMYKPFIEAKHGPQAAITEIELLRLYFRKGWLTQIMHKGEMVYALLQHERAGICHMRVGGVKEGNTDWLKQEAGTAAYYFSIMRAREKGLPALDLGLTRPLLDDGVFRYKKKWGAAVSHGTTLYQGLWVGIGRDVTAAAGFLAHHPFAWMDRKGRWHGLVTFPSREQCSETDLKRLLRRHTAPGLESLFVVAPFGFSDDVQRRIVPGPVPSIGKAIEMPINNG